MGLPFHGMRAAIKGAASGVCSAIAEASKQQSQVKNIINKTYHKRLDGGIR